MNAPVMQTSSSPDGVNSTSDRGQQKVSASATENGHGSLITYTIIALGLALFIRFFIAAPYIVSGASMVPTFNDYHYLIIDRISYNIENPARGDVIVFDLPQNVSRALIKRIIGLPNETVILSDSTVTIVNSQNPNGFLLAEPYLDPANLGGASNMRITLGPDQYFVMGDNRAVSADSRLWGPLPREEIVGRAFLRLYPLTRIDFFPGKAEFSE